MAADQLCERCTSVDWIEAGLPRILPELDTLELGSLPLTITSDAIRLPTGDVVATGISRQTQSLKLLVDLGHMDEIHGRIQGCRFCNFFLALLVRHFSMDDLNRAQADAAHLYVYTERYGTVTRTQVGDLGMRSVSIMCFQLAFQDGFACDRSARFSLLQPQLHDPEQSTTDQNICASFMSRPVFRRLNTDRIKSWMDTCSSQHSTSAESHPESSFLSLGPPSTDVRVIDVDERCLKTIPLRDPEKRYAALSYVWDVKQQDIRLTTENLALFSTPGGIPTLSRTVEDALQITKAIGLKYFWCDVISILQDDNDDKETYIFDMDKIYTYASLTIAAAGGGTCHEGLYGVSRDRIPLQNSTAAGIDLIEVQDQPRRPHGSFGVTTGWPSRGWTLQEFVMSQKTLLFCEQQTLWICCDADWIEGLDVDGEDFRIADCSGLNRPQLHSPIFTNSSTTTITNNRHLSSSSLQTDLTDVLSLIETYTTRLLSYDTDIRNAFEGLTWYISSLSSHLTAGFSWGIPETNFEALLCWTAQPRSNRTQARRTTFPNAPTWSWMAWLGPIQFPPFASSTPGAKWKPIIKCYKYPTYTQRQGREPNDIASGFGSENTILNQHFEILDNNTQAGTQLELESESSSIVFWAEAVEIVLDTSWLSQIGQSGSEDSSTFLRTSDGASVRVLELSIASQLTESVRDHGSVGATLVAVVLEEDVLDSSFGEDERPQSPCRDSLRKAHCLLVLKSGCRDGNDDGDGRAGNEGHDREDNRVTRVGVLTLATTDWYRLKRTLKFFVLS